MAGEPGITLYEFIRKCAGIESFKTCISPLADNDREQLADEELVLRFFALKNGLQNFKGSVRDWLDGYMELVILGQLAFDSHSQAIFVEPDVEGSIINVHTAICP